MPRRRPSYLDAALRRAETETSLLDLAGFAAPNAIAGVRVTQCAAEAPNGVCASATLSPATVERAD